MAGHKYDGDILRGLADQSRRFHSVHLFHLDIEENGIGFETGLNALNEIGSVRIMETADRVAAIEREYGLGDLLSEYSFIIFIL